MEQKFLPEIMLSICSKAASNMWLAFDAMATHSYKTARMDPHSVVCRRQSISWCNERVRCSTEKQKIPDYSLSLLLFDPFTAKLQQLPWHLSDFPVNNLLNVPFGFKLSSHFVARVLTIVSGAIHMQPKRLFWIDCFFVSLGFNCLYIFSLHISYIIELIFISWSRKHSCCFTKLVWKAKFLRSHKQMGPY